VVSEARDGTIRLARFNEASAVDLVLLGLSESGAPVAAQAIDEGAVPQGHRLIDLRSLAMQGLIPQEELALLAQARSLLFWHQRHGFCANCGMATKAVDGGYRRDCAACGAQHFPRTDPVVIMLAIDSDRCLLGRQSRFVKGVWSCLAGFVEPGETIEAAVRRETHEEAGIACGYVTYLASQPWPFPMSLMIGCHAQAITTDIVIDRNELEDARWFSRDEAAALLTRTHPDGLATPPPMAIAHHIIRTWIEGVPTF
jgi:NAD+ diphosphatase